MKAFLPARRLACLIAGLALLPGLAAAAPEPIEVVVTPDKVEWFPNAEWAVAQLIITGPDCLHAQHDFRVGERIIFTAVVNGDPLPDGVYSYDLRLAPDLEVRGLNEPAGQGQLCRGREDLPSLDVLTSAGYVTILDARFVDPSREEDRLADEARAGGEGDGGEGGEVVALGAPVRSISAAATVLTNADGVIRNSLCVGFDCPNNPSFGSDTIRLQENNLRIHFDDTSTLAGFPNRDWRIIANDSASGGASKFSIEDSTGARTPFTIEANAPTNSLYVDDGGRVGFGTSTPVVELHARNGDTPTLRLEQDGSSGFAPQTWDLPGNENSFFVRDATNGSTLPFRIQPGTASNTLFLASDEQVGVGTTAPEAPLEVQNPATGLTLLLDAPGDVFFRQRNTVSGQFVDVNLIGNDFRVNFNTGGGGPELILTNNGDLTVTGDVFSATCTAPGNPCAPDFVFEAGYPLMDLDQLGSFIAENKHLPAVPSEDEFERQGRINLGQFQMTLLQKIEELTLYTLQQHETIGRQQETISRLEERLARLEGAPAGEPAAAP
jgi:hypothetical protein